MTNDPHAWLEDVTGDEALAWVTGRNARTEQRLTAAPLFTELESGIREVLDAPARIPFVGHRGGYFYNFWTDERNPRGLWRRTTPEQYRTDSPEWEILLDVDALNAAEGENWVWHGARFLRPDLDRVLIDLSRGGADADVTREFDMVTRDWVPGGFVRPEAKGGASWLDRDTLLVATDLGEGTTTESGYPRTVRRWTRGTPLAEAELVYSGEPGDLSVSAYRDHTPGFERTFVRRALEFYSDELYLLGDDGELRKIDVPDSAIADVEREWLLLELREDWAGFRAGSLLAARFDDVVAGTPSWEVLFAPTDESSLAGYTWTRHHLVLNVLENVVNRLSVLTPGEQGWARAEFPGAPEFGSVGVSAVDSDENDDVWLTVTDYLTPASLAIATVGSPPETLKSAPAFFDSSGHVIEQHFVTSDDGTRVPYFLVRPADLAFDGTAPTLLYGYGGFEIALTPGYSGGTGRSWLTRGGVYAVANIRGGGEYGPRWHRAALRENRPRAYEDMAAVARDLVERRITAPSRLAVQGGSNGGLLAGNMLVRYPELFGAVVIQVPLLDMKRYSHLLAGASWMAEYGDPDTDDWDFIRTFSPYHLIDADAGYPPVILLTSTRDDRVHPGHARKFAAALEAAGHDVTYYENIEGGHGGAADNAQAARMAALAYAFLWEKLGRATGH
ncbi:MULTISPECIES: prolyl oligopeptidase family serine peptidase [Pseudonocardia]|uniref:Prolyl endopeptidase n=2 Tax=Pseudonocardia TaxID=1847 RepID=A0A1Y2MYZ6_PSEAH|nr:MULTISPECIES: prolyl oligopeptidase family serine peptidase [Pseudonocardia]OSY39858.1 Prolyl endopeptidase [Pseudonocardia autotrophica]TDN74454.1 prolyl oligopeptidase [Pseudonocardia autotrophica]BBG05221.1 prolyl oligopeptidase [Pseudonocardia autotrophica]GEC25771.1 prolyl oligopeptidase [Pseudonocardia saturnea]